MLFDLSCVLASLLAWLGVIFSRQDELSFFCDFVRLASSISCTAHLWERTYYDRILPTLCALFVHSALCT